MGKSVKPGAESSSSGSSDSESDHVSVIVEPKPKPRHKRRGTKKEASKQVTPVSVQSGGGCDENGNQLIDTGRKSRSEKKEKVLEVIHPVKIKHCESKPDPSLDVKYSRVTETEYRKAFGVKLPDQPFVPKQYLLRTPRLIERNKSCLDLKPDSEPHMVWTTTYLQDFTYREKGDGEELLGAGLPTPKYSFVQPKRTRSKEKKCFDDDEDANPTLRNFIKTISRK